MMILNTEQEKIDFLEECYSHIDRIYNHFVKSNKNHTNITLHKNDKIDEQNINCLSTLPSSIIINGKIPAKNYDVGKLLVLISLYNNVASRTIEKSDVDLKNEFNTVKQDLYFTLLNSGLPSAHILMKKHRQHFLRSGILGYILNFVWTESSSNFLSKYEFFTKKSDWEDDFNFRYDLATNCHFDVNMISQIEPIGLGLGYLIKAKSTEEATIIMNAIREQLTEVKLDDSIRFIDTKSMSTKTEGSSTIEIWGQAVEIIENLIDKRQKSHF